MKIIFLTGALLLHSSLAAEWFTSKGFHCTERCRVGARGGYQEIYWCPAVDGEATVHRPSSAGNTEEDRILWDFCTPAPEELEKPTTEKLEPNENEGSSGEGGSGFHGGDDSHATGLGFQASSLPGVVCASPCTNQGSGGIGTTWGSNCQVPGQDDRFPCSPEYKIERVQLGSHNKLWCMDLCRQQGSFHMCKTMTGRDHCSPREDRNSFGNLCAKDSPCQPDYQGENKTGHYRCDSAEGEAVNMVDCGFWQVDSVHKKLEFTEDDKICASPCLEKDGGKYCEYVQWIWEEGKQQAKLVSGLGACGGYSEGWSWKNWAILAGGIIGGLLIIGLVAFVVSKKGYARAASSEP